MSVEIYSYAKCGTCQNAIKWLKSESISVRVIDICEQPPNVQQLRDFIMRSGLSMKHFFNTSGEVYKQMQLKDKLPSLSEQQQLELLASHGKLIKRPIVTDGTRVTVGYKPEDFAKIWGSV